MPVKADGVDVLERTVTRLHREVEGLRAALRYRAIIEQAKGVLVARLGIEPEVAFRRLVERSQHHNRKLSAIAAGVVAHALANTEARGEVPDDASVDDINLHLAAAAFAAAPGSRALVDSVVAELADLEVTGAALFACEAGGTLRLLHEVGVSPGASAGWERVPMTADLPLTEAARTGCPVLLRDRAARLDGYPGTRLIPLDEEASAALPLFQGNQLIGVLVLLWSTPFDVAAVRPRLTGIAETVVPRLQALLSRHQDELIGLQLEPGYDDWFHRFLDALPAPIVLFEPQRDDGRILDLVVVHANTASAGAPGPAGRGVLERWPQLARTELFDHVRQVLEGGMPWSAARFTVPEHADRPKIVLEDLQVCRIGSLVAIACRDVAVGDQSRRSNR